MKEENKDKGMVGCVLEFLESLPQNLVSSSKSHCSCVRFVFNVRFVRFMFNVRFVRFMWTQNVERENHQILYLLKF